MPGQRLRWWICLAGLYLLLAWSRAPAELVVAAVAATVGTGVMDRYLGRGNDQDQQADVPIDPATRRDNNMFEPPPGDPGAHGRFDDQANARSPQLWLTMHKRAVLAGAAPAGGAVLSLRAASPAGRRAP